MDYYLCFTARDELCIYDGTPIKECRSLVGRYLKAIGINCTDPKFLTNLIKEIKSVYDGNVVVHPNSGEVFDALSKTWSGEGCCVVDSAKSWIDAGANIIGGCCRTTPEDIANLAKLIRNINAN